VQGTSLGGKEGKKRASGEVRVNLALTGKHKKGETVGKRSLGIKTKRKRCPQVRGGRAKLSEFASGEKKGDFFEGKGGGVDQQRKLLSSLKENIS